MRFDSSARAQHLLRKTWNADPRLLRYSVVKMGNKLEEICDVGGKASEWADVPENEGSTRAVDDDMSFIAQQEMMRDVAENEEALDYKF